MNALGLLAAVLALAVYPGGLFIAAAALVHRAASGGGRPVSLTPRARAIAVLAAVSGGALAPLAGSPALHLPPPAGASTSLAAVLILLAIAVDLSDFPRTACMVLGLSALPLVALAAEVGSLDLPAISGAPGLGLAARAGAAGATVLACAAMPARSDLAGVVVAATVAVAASSLVIPAALSAAPAINAALASLGVVAAVGGISRLVQLVPWSRAALLVAAMSASAAATSLALLAPRF